MYKEMKEFVHLRDTFNSEIPMHYKIIANIIPDHTSVEGSTKK